MNAPTVIAFAVAAVFALGDWYAKARANKALEYLSKPATLVALIVAACTLTPAHDAHTRRVLFVVALIASLKGDVFLMFDDRGDHFFILGLAAFLFGHIAYVAGFWTHGPAIGALVVAALLVSLVVAPLARRILASLRDDPTLRPPVAAYIGVISVMLATALATLNPWAVAGAALFVWSDSMIAWNRFVRPFRAADVAIMVTYHLGQAGLVLSLLR